MVWWITALLWAGTFLLSQLLAPDPQIENAKAGTLDDFSFPTATEGRVVPLVYGTEKIDGPNVIWYGDLRIVPITQKVKVNLFSSKTFVTGYKYYVGIQFGICLGEATLKRVFLGDVEVWNGSQSTEGSIKIKAKNIKGTLHFYPGTLTQSVNAYLAKHQSPAPAYRGICYAVWERGYVGEQTTIKPWSFEVERVPDAISLGASMVVNDHDVNPIRVAHEILTNSEWGYGYPASDINTSSFGNAAALLKSEGNGMSFILNSATKATDVLKEIERQIDGRFRLDASSGQWVCDLVRNDYDIGSITALDNDNILELMNFTRGTWDQTVNEVRVMFKRRSHDYMEGFAPAQDMANIAAQGRVVPATYTYIGVKDDDLANALAWRELRATSFPFASARVRVDRTFWDAYVGMPIKFSYVCQDFEVTDIPMRVASLDVGNLDGPDITMDLIQDVFSHKVGVFNAEDIPGWTAPDTGLTPIPADEQIAFEAPYAISRRDDIPAEGRVWAGAASQGRAEAGIYIDQRTYIGSPTGSYSSGGEIAGFLYVGELAEDISIKDTSFDVTTTLDVGEVFVGDDFNIGQNLMNLMMIGDELVACGSASAITGGLALSSVRRAMCDTAPAVHTTGEPVFFLFAGGSLVDQAINPSYHMQVRLRPFSSEEAIASTDPGITTMTVDMNNRERRPYPPSVVKLNGTTWPDSVAIDSGVTVSINRRDWRIYDEVSQLEVDASTINTDFPAANSTQYRLSLLEGESVIWTGSWNDGSASFSAMTLSKIILEYNGLPFELKVVVETRHTYESVVYEALQIVAHDATVVSALIGDVYLGIMDTGQLSRPWTAPDAGNYAFEIEAAIASDLQVLVNHTFPLQTVIVAGNTTGTLTGITAGDIIEVRHTDSSSSDQVLLTIGSPVSDEDAFGVLTFENLYGPLYGGFGRAGFGTGPFGR